MTHGGWLRNSIIIVRGPTGSGKTMLAGLYARAGAVARRARRLLRVRGAAADPAPQLRSRSACRMDHARRAPATCRSSCRYPEATSLEDLLVDLRLGLEEFKPSLDRDRQHLVDRARLVREGLPPVHDRRGVDPARARPQRADDPDRDRGAPRASTRRRTSRRSPTRSSRSTTRAHGYELIARCGVIKMRGSDHETHPYRLMIKAPGLQVQRIPADEIGRA